MTKTLLVVLALTALAACTPPKGTGFTGIGDEPKVASASQSGTAQP